MKKSIVAFGLSFFSSMTFCQQQRGEIEASKLPEPGRGHYMAEYNLDAAIEPGAWLKVAPGMHAAFGSVDELYFRSEVPQIQNENASFTATGWKGERVNAQVVVWSPEDLQQVRFSVSDLKNEQGEILNKNIIGLKMIGYVVSNFPYGSKEASCGGSPYKTGWLMPDRFEAFERFDVPAKSVRPVWFSADIPATAKPGNYKGTIDVSSKQGHAKLQVNIKVQNELLPKPHEWKYRLDLWQNPWIIADYYHVKPWSDEHMLLLKKHTQLYADAGAAFITTYGVHSPWAGGEYGIEGGMIEWIKRKDGSWKFDYSIFDKYVELCMSLGIDKALTVYTPLPFSGTFRYVDEATGNYVDETWTPTSDTFSVNWHKFLTDLRSHLEKKGWFNKSYIGLNENAMDVTQAAIKMIKSHSKDWKITYAGDWNPVLDTALSDYCFKYGKEASKDEVMTRTRRGQTTTYYVCCEPAKPNTFLFSPPIEGRWISWYVAAHGYDGFLRWAFDAWPADPLRDARYGSWAAGDCYMVYPGGSSSIRFEKLREGIVDYEKMRILRELVSKSNNASAKKLLAELDAHLQTLNGETEFNEDKLKNDVKKGRQLVDQISDLLTS